MESKARFLGHPVHPMLVTLPLGAFVLSLVFDLIAMVGGYASMSLVAFWLIGAGVLAGLLAAAFGLVDLLAIPSGTRAARIAVWHGLGNGAVVLLFAISWVLRLATAGPPPPMALALSWLGVALVLLTAWLGGELVTRLGVGVSDGAGLDAPNSLRRTSAAPESMPQPRGVRSEARVGESVTTPLQPRQ